VAVIAAGAVFVYSLHHSGSSVSAVQRIENLGTGAPNDPNRTLDSRLQDYGYALHRIARNPVVGVGLQTYGIRNGHRLPHNIFIGVWYQTGLVGLLGIVFVLASLARTSWLTIIHASEKSERQLAIGLGASIAAFLVFLMSEPQLFIRYGWITAALMLALRAIELRRDRRDDAHPAPAIH
jgi:O-antigen ligase